MIDKIIEHIEYLMDDTEYELSMYDEFNNGWYSANGRYQTLLELKNYLEINFKDKK